MIDEFDNKTKQFGFSLIALTFVFFLILVAKPFDMKGNLLILTIGTLLAFIPALTTMFRAIRLYGPNSAEGKIWTKIFLMAVVFALGVVLTDTADTTHPFAYFVIIAFALIIWGIFEKIKNAGIRPTKFDIAVAGSMTVILGALLFAYMSYVVSQISEPFTFGEYYAEMIATLVSIIVVFMAIMMARLMGGYVSKGWHYISLGAALFAIFYAVLIPLRFVGWYEKYYFMEIISIMALNAATFSAYYQRKEHLKLISF